MYAKYNEEPGYRKNIKPGLSIKQNKNYILAMQNGKFLFHLVYSVKVSQK